MAPRTRSLLLLKRFHSTRTNDGIIQLGARKPNARQPTKDSANSKNGAERKRISPGAIAMLAVPTAAFSLGLWQTYRLRWKLGLISDLETNLDHPAVDFPLNDLSALEDLEYRTVTLKGEFLHDREFLISPRGRFDPGRTDRSSGLIADSNMSSHGAHVITPFRVHRTDLVILVNRGWVPSDKTDPKTREAGQIRGTVEFEAIVRKSETRPQFVGENIPERGVWYYKNFQQMAKQYDTAPVYVEAKYGSTVEGGPIGGQTNISVRNEHLSYLLTWYSLCAVTTAMWLMKFWK
ncbi:hypothetical protein QR680_017577 [Steinernema hermaphroditum]|uniref:SURF1-like protein n=1 Tax=Steinernema hermaphroditum TaxID=289476 RepID=A0AA39HF35_9BILA|nr:hypothetical protein QR680_017577 [Steinernema hermaphroditum]